MKHIFWGFLLIFLDFHLTLGNVKIGLIPDFAGYLVMMTGLAELSAESERFGQVRPFVGGMAAYTGLLYAMDIFGLSDSMGAISYFLAILSTAVSLYISYSIVMAVRDMEENRQVLLGAGKLKSNWTIMAVFQIVVYVVLIIPMLAVLCIIISLIAAVYFLIAFHRSANMYEAVKTRPTTLGEGMED